MVFKHITTVILLTIIVTTAPPVLAQCKVTDRLCLMDEISKTVPSIDNKAWQDKTLRELAKSYTYEGQEDKAIALIDKIEKPDTKAMAIRGIGMAAADRQWPNAERYTTLFKKLTLKAEKIDHKPSHAIAYTYIAMAQAFAKDDAGAMATAKSMSNDALRNKAFGETAEVQAERGDLVAVTASIAEINSLAFRNKAYATVAKIFTKTGKLDSAYAMANKIENPYSKAQALQNIVNFNNEEEKLNN